MAKLKDDELIEFEKVYKYFFIDSRISKGEVYCGLFGFAGGDNEFMTLEGDDQDDIYMVGFRTFDDPSVKPERIEYIDRYDKESIIKIVEYLMDGDLFEVGKDCYDCFLWEDLGY